MVAKRPAGLTLYPLWSLNGLTVYLVARLYPLCSLNALLGPRCTLHARQTTSWAHAVPFMVAKRPLGLTLYPLCSSNSLTVYLVARLYPLCTPNGLTVYLVARLYPLCSLNALLGPCCTLYARQTASWAHAVPFILAERPHRVTSWPDCTYRGCSLFGASECLSALVIGPSDFKVLVGGHDAALSGEYGRGNNHPSYLCLMPCA